MKRLTGWKHLIIMLFGVLKHFDSLRELEIGMKAETMKLSHLGLDYVVRRSTLAEANLRRSQEFFAKVYAYLLERYTPFLADSRSMGHKESWEKQLYRLDSTTITLFDNLLKGVGLHPKHGKKKGGMKVHTVMKYQVGVPMVVELTSAAKHDHYLLKMVHLPKESTLTMDRAYIDYIQFQRLTEEGVCYVTKMKKNLTYKELSSTAYVSREGLVTHIDKYILFQPEFGLSLFSKNKVRPTFGVRPQLQETLSQKCTGLLLQPPTRTRSARVRCFSFFAFTSSPYDCKKLGNSNLRVKVSPLFPSPVKAEKRYFLHAQHAQCQRLAGEGEGKNFELAECAMRRGVSVRA